MLIIGGDSMIGRALVCSLRAYGREVVSTTRHDVVETEQLRKLDLSMAVDEWKIPEACEQVIFCAAVGNMETCREQPKATREINVEHTGALAKRLVDGGSFVLFLSTNMVHDGSRALVPDTATVRPCVEYGRQKAAAEEIFMSLGDQGAVVRLTKVFQRNMPLLNRWMKALAEGASVEAFEDYFCSPVTLSNVVSGLEGIIHRRGAGIWQFSPPDQISYADIAREIARGLGVTPQLVKGVSAKGQLEHVPQFTSLDSSRAATELQISCEMSAAVIQKICFS